MYGRSLVSGVGTKPGKQAFRLHAGETPALPAPVTKDLSYTHGSRRWTAPDEVLHAWTGALLADMDSAESKLPALADLEGLEGGTNMATVSQALYAEWLAGVRAQHVAEGLAQGVERECARAMARLRRQAAIKFGPRTAERLSDLLRPVIAAEQLDRLDRVSDWLVECQQGEDLLSRVAALVGNGADGR